MASSPPRERVKRPIQPCPRQATQASYTQPPASRDDLLGGATKQKKCPVVEFSSQAVPQPFLDPSILPRRVQENQQWKLSQEKEKSAGEASQSS